MDGGMAVNLGVSIFGQGVLKLLLDRLINMMGELQQIGYLDELDINYPANAKVYQAALKSLIEFHALKPENIIKNFDSDFEYDDVVEGASDVAKDIDDYQFLIIILGLSEWNIHPCSRLTPNMPALSCCCLASLS